MTPDSRRGQTLRLALAALITLLNIAPLVWIFSSGFKTQAEIFQIPPVWIPDSLYLENFKVIISENLPFLLNSIIIASMSTVLCLILAMPAAFALARFFIPGKKHLRMWIISTRMMPPIAAALPLFLIVKGLGLFDTKIAMILLYAGFNLPFAIWMSLTFMRNLPGELIEAALIDGCSWRQVFLKVVVPISRTGIATVGIFAFLFAWNELLFALFMTSRNAKTFPVVLTEFQGQTNTVWEQMAAASAFQVVPVIVMTLLVQRYIVSGLTMGAVKG